MVIFFIITYIKQLKSQKVSNELYNFLDKNLEFLNTMHRKKVAAQIKNSLEVYLQFQIIQKITKADYITFFKYDYSKKYVGLNFMFSIDANGSMIQNSIFEDLSLTGNLLTMDVFKSINCDLCDLKLNDFEHKCPEIHGFMKQKEVHKIYFRNIFKDQNHESPVAFIVVSYKDANHILSDDDKNEIKRILNTINDIDVDSPSSELLKIKKTNEDIIKDPNHHKRINSISLIGMLSLIFILLFKTCYIDSTHYIFSQYFEPPQIMSVSRGLVKTPFERGLIEYNEGNYKESLGFFEESLKDDTSNLGLFYAGVSSLFLDKEDPKKCLHYFSRIEENTALHDEINWYSAACYFKLRDYEKTKEILDSLSHESKFYSKKAFNLLRRLD